MDNLLHIIVINKSIQENKVAYLKTLLKQNAKIGLFTPESRENIKEATKTIKIHFEPTFVHISSDIDLPVDASDDRGHTIVDSIFSNPQLTEVDTVVIITNSVLIPYIWNYLCFIQKIIPKTILIRTGEMVYIQVKENHCMKL